MLIDLNHLNIIEEKLSIGLSLSKTEDIEPIRNIIESFRRIWKWYEEHPNFSSELGDDSNMFCSIFNDMSSRFSYTNSTELTAVCDYCEIEFPLLNNDALFAYQMHEQTQEHIETVNNLKMFHSTHIEDAMQRNGGSEVSSDNRKISCTTATEEFDQPIEGRQIHCTRCKLQLSSLRSTEGHICGSRHQKPTVFTNSMINTKHKSKSGSHVNEKKSQRNSELLPEILISSSVDISLADLYNLPEKGRLTYFFNKICIFLQEIRDGYVYYDCALCNFHRIEAGNLKNHMRSREHRDGIVRIIEKCNVEIVSFEIGIFHSKFSNGLKCFLCNVTLQESNSHNYVSHLQSRMHNHNSKIHFKSPRFKNWEKGIILRNGHPHCIFCEVSLPNLVSMQEHLKTVHKIRISM